MNPFERYLKEEDKLQHSVIRYVKTAYNGAMVHHSSNEGRRTKFEQFKAKYLGMDAGFPDLLIVYRSKILFIELKTAKGKPTYNQKRWVDGLKENGFASVIAYGFDNAKTLIDTCFKSVKA